MIDASLFAHLLASVPSGTRILLLGDADQLPPVDGGGFFADLVSLYGIHLTECRRAQSETLQQLYRAARLCEEAPIDAVLEEPPSDWLETLMVSVDLFSGRDRPDPARFFSSGLIAHVSSALFARGHLGHRSARMKRSSLGSRRKPRLAIGGQLRSWLPAMMILLGFTTESRGSVHRAKNGKRASVGRRRDHIVGRTPISCGAALEVRDSICDVGAQKPRERIRRSDLLASRRIGGVRPRSSLHRFDAGEKTGQNPRYKRAGSWNARPLHQTAKWIERSVGLRNGNRTHSSNETSSIFEIILE